jgi:hypothetical protein
MNTYEMLPLLYIIGKVLLCILPIGLFVLAIMGAFHDPIVHWQRWDNEGGVRVFPEGLDAEPPDAEW